MSKAPSVRIACPKGRPFQLRYFCPEEQREIRISTGTRNMEEAEALKAELEAKLLLGIDAKPSRSRKVVSGPHMPWDVFREHYSAMSLSQLRESSEKGAESRLDTAERIVKPRILSDMANRDNLESLQAKLLIGEGALERKRKKGDPATPRKNPRPRSAHTVKSYMAAVIAALNWAARRGWIETVPQIDRVKTSKLRAMKGRPITTEEFERMLAKVPDVVGESVADSWTFVLRGLWSSALRLEELMNVSWDDEYAICPHWQRGRLPTLYIPASMQKNDTEESIPLLPWFEKVLLEVPENKRRGYVFNPESLQGLKNRKASTERPTPEWVGRIICRIGKAAGVVVHKGEEKTGRKPKFASAHDLRRACAERLLDAEVPPEAVSRVLRHASFETTKRHYASGNVQKVAKQINVCLGTVLTID